MVKHKIFQFTNLISAEDYQRLMDHKDTIVGQRKASTTIKGDEIVEDYEIKNISVDTNDWKSRRVSKEAINNENIDIEGFIKVLGNQFYPIFKAIEEKLLLEIKAVNPRPYNCRCYRNNRPIAWHKHTMKKGLKPSQFWIAIYYMHPNWDTSYGGDLRIGMTELENLEIFKCYSNSVIIHNGYYGHAVDKLLPGFKGDRDILLSHWMSE